MVWVETLTFATDEAMSSLAVYRPSILEIGVWLELGTGGTKM